MIERAKKPNLGYIEWKPGKWRAKKWQNDGIVITWLHGKWQKAKLISGHYITMLNLLNFRLNKFPSPPFCAGRIFSFIRLLTGSG